MEHTLSVLRGAKDIAGALPIPYVDTAVGAALNIVELAKVRLANIWPGGHWGLLTDVTQRGTFLRIQEVKDAKEECKDLAERAAKYTREIYDQLKKYEKALDGQSDTEPLEELLRFVCSHYRRSDMFADGFHQQPAANRGQDD